MPAFPEGIQISDSGIDVKGERRNHTKTDGMHLFSRYFHAVTSRLRSFTITSIAMGKNMKETHSCPPHDCDLMTSGFPQHASTSESTMVDTHTQLRSKYPAKGEYETVFDFVKGRICGQGSRDSSGVSWKCSCEEYRRSWRIGDERVPI